MEAMYMYNLSVVKLTTVPTASIQWTCVFCVQWLTTVIIKALIMRPYSLGGGRILRRTLSVRLSVCPSVPLSLPSVTSFRQPLASRMYFSARTEGIRIFRHALRAAYRTAISAAQILVSIIISYFFVF